MKKIKQTKQKLTKKKSRCEDTIGDDEQDTAKRVTSKEGKRIKSKETGRKSCERSRATSAEKIEKEPTSPAKISAAAAKLCNWVLGMRESSVNAYFDKHLASYAPTDRTTNDWEKNASKNRSKEHKLYDQTRVKLNTSAEQKNDYINASLMTFEPWSETEFIVTQYPLLDTTLDFWRMVSEREVDRVISIFEPYVDEAIEEFNKVPDPSPVQSPATTTVSSESSTGIPVKQSKSQVQQLIENNSIRCEPNNLKSYYPLFEGHYMNLEGWIINTRKVETDDRNKNWLATYTVEVLPEGCSNATFVRVFNCSTWQWKKVPSEEKKLLHLVRAPWKDLLTTFEATTDGKTARPTKHKPVVIMCDLGLDRSATTIFTFILLEMIMNGKPPDCEAIFKKMRDQRADVFTMSIFFTYSIRVVLFYLRIKLKMMGTEVGDDVVKLVNEALTKLPSKK